MTKIVPPPSSTSKPPRVSVPVTAEVLAIFERLAKAGNMSTGRAMAEWLADTVEAAELMASTMERARAAPKIVTAELHAMMLGMADQSKELSDKFRSYRGNLADFKEGEAVAKRTASGKRSAPPSLDAAIPPPCNTGGKLPGQGQPKRVVRKPPSIGKSLLSPEKVQVYVGTNGIPPKATK